MATVLSAGELALLLDNAMMQHELGVFLIGMDDAKCTIMNDARS